jgi:hypothetical protein
MRAVPSFIETSERPGGSVDDVDHTSGNAPACAPPVDATETEASTYCPTSIDESETSAVAKTPSASKFVTTAIDIGTSIVALPFVPRTENQYVPTAAVTFAEESKPPLDSVMPAGNAPEPGESEYVMPAVEPEASAKRT